MLDKPGVTIYTDGACSGNPGPGGYAAVLTSGRYRREISGGYRKTTNNRMELMACIEALKLVKRPSRIVIYSDSKYVVDGITKGWAQRWSANGWRKADRKPALNRDLWSRLLELCANHDVEFRWVRGHVGHDENELCDTMAVTASQQPDLPEDEGYTE